MVEDGPVCSVAKFLSEDILNQMIKASAAKKGDLVLILAGKKPDVLNQLGQLRLMMAKDLNLIDESKFNFLWVTEFPLVEWDEEARRFVALHHPFTSPKEEDIPLMDSDPASVNSRAYDLVLNGSEIGGGSIRIFDQDLQKKMFDVLGIKEDEAQEKFGFLLDAFRFGPPPHAGIALGLDRIAMILTGASSLRDVIAFPKNQKAQSLMDNSPGDVDNHQLDELHIAIKKPRD